MSELRERAWKGLGMALGAVVSWPTVSKYLGTLPDFVPNEQVGTGAGFIFGMLLFTTEIVQRLLRGWRNGWKLVAFLAVAGVWVYLNWKLPQVYEAALEQPNIAADRARAAKLAVFSMAFLWSVPLTYVGGLLGKHVARYKTPP
jgi:hypothetical protein